MYQKLKTDTRHNKELKLGQLELLESLNLMLRTRPGFKQTPPELDDFLGWPWAVFHQTLRFAGGAASVAEDQPRGACFS